MSNGQHIFISMGAEWKGEPPRTTNHLSPGGNADVGGFLRRRCGGHQRGPRSVVRVSHPLLGRARMLAQPRPQLVDL